jgi:uncharacterized protein (TIGR02284 family)
VTDIQTGAGDEALEKMQDLLTVVIDSRNSYRDALKDTKHQNMAVLFSRMIDLKDRHISELELLFRERGREPDESGSFLTTVNKVILTFRSIFGGVNESVIPGLVEGETRIVGYYSQAITASTSKKEKQSLTRQRLELTEEVAYMRSKQK